MKNEAAREAERKEERAQEGQEERQEITQEQHSLKGDPIDDALNADSFLYTGEVL